MDAERGSGRRLARLDQEPSRDVKHGIVCRTATFMPKLLEETSDTLNVKRERSNTRPPHEQTQRQNW